MQPGIPVQGPTREHVLMLNQWGLLCTDIKLNSYSYLTALTAIAVAAVAAVASCVTVWLTDREMTHYVVNRQMREHHLMTSLTRSNLIDQVR